MPSKEKGPIPVPMAFLFECDFPKFIQVKVPRYFTDNSSKPEGLTQFLCYLKAYGTCQIRYNHLKSKDVYVFYRSMNPEIRSKNGYVGKLIVRKNIDNTPAMTLQEAIDFVSQRKWEKKKEVKGIELNENDGLKYIGEEGGKQ